MTERAEKLKELVAWAIETGRSDGDPNTFDYPGFEEESAEARKVSPYVIRAICEELGVTEAVVALLVGAPVSANNDAAERLEMAQIDAADALATLLEASKP